jgi:hypothetical protein
MLQVNSSSSGGSVSSVHHSVKGKQLCLIVQDVYSTDTISVYCDVNQKCWPVGTVSLHYALSYIDVLYLTACGTTLVYINICCLERGCYGHAQTTLSIEHVLFQVSHITLSC